MSRKVGSLSPRQRPLVRRIPTYSANYTTGVRLRATDCDGSSIELVPCLQLIKVGAILDQEKPCHWQLTVFYVLRGVEPIGFGSSLSVRSLDNLVPNFQVQMIPCTTVRSLVLLI